MNRLSILLILLCSSTLAKVDFNTQIRPILSDNCFHCHGPDRQNQKADLRLDEPEGLYDVDDNGWAYLNPGNPKKSLVYYHITSEEKDEIMPPVNSERKLTEDQKKLMRQWILEGAEYKEHWAFTKVINKLEEFSVNDEWVKNEIDHFILDKLKKEGINPNRKASSEKLIRRVYLQLTGLPPTPEELNKHLDDKAPDAYERLIDELMETDHYAERQALKWLDVARYADTDGYQRDFPRHMWPWRDWVISAYKNNMPYDEFIIQQLAGDLLPDRKLNNQIASGFNRNHRVNSEGGSIPEEFRVENNVDRTITLGTAVMGLTMDCARCHDHKYDPISQKEFFQLYAYFNSMKDSGLGANGGNTPPLVKLKENWSVNKKLEYQQPFTKNLQYQGEIKKQLLLDLKELNQKYPNLNTKKLFLVEGVRNSYDFKNGLNSVMVSAEDPNPPPVYILNRGVYNDPITNEQIFPGVPEVLNREIKGSPKTRLELAKWLMHPKNPITPRVYVNRIWANFFGRGLANNVDNLGSQGEMPTHLELLDWLAFYAIANDWDQRKIIKKILMSATYQQSSIVSRKNHVSYPTLEFYHRGPRFRMDAYQIRDQSLYFANLLNQKVGGPSVKPYMPKGIWSELSYKKNHFYVQDKAPDIYRKSMYTFWKRTAPPPNMVNFNAGRRVMCTVENEETNTPLQSLTLLNNVTFVENAKGMAYRLAQTRTSFKGKISYAFQFATGRTPNRNEVKIMSKIYKDAKANFFKNPEKMKDFLDNGELPIIDYFRTPELAGLMQVCLAIMNLDEVITIE